MKVDTTNSLSLPFILSSEETRLFIVTGKGGVGKTTLAMALTKSLKDQGHNVLYNCFDQPLNNTLSKNINLPHFKLEMQSSAKEYIAKKLGSDTIAGWILKTPFFSSLFNMLPGLGHMILLGHIINKLEEDPTLKIVLDSPSSGHALTMFESPINFREMFRTGLIVEDIDRMENFIHHRNRMKVLITALPTQMAIQESMDLEKSLKKRNVENFGHVLNDVLSCSPSLSDIDPSHYPEFLRKKIELENELFKGLDGKDHWSILPHFSQEDPSLIVRDASQFIGEAKT